MNSRIITRIAIVVAVSSVLVAALVPVAGAQTNDEPLRDRIRARIENTPGLQDQERDQLREHLSACEQAGLSGEALDTLFPEGEALRDQIRHQQRVATMAREGLPVEPLVDKLREGRRKNAPAPVLDRVMNQLEQHVRTADRALHRAREAGLQAADRRTERRLTESVARNMWRDRKSTRLNSSHYS